MPSEKCTCGMISCECEIVFQVNLKIMQLVVWYLEAVCDEIFATNNIRSANSSLANLFFTDEFEYLKNVVI